MKDLAAHLSAESGAHMALMLQNLTAMRQEMTDLKAENRQLQRLLGPGWDQASLVDRCCGLTEPIW